VGEDVEEEKQLEDTRTGGPEHEVQRCKSERSSCAKVQKWEAALGPGIGLGLVSRRRGIASGGG
jgi:hypothetical protein